MLAPHMKLKFLTASLAPITAQRDGEKNHPFADGEAQIRTGWVCINLRQNKKLLEINIFFPKTSD